MPLWLSLLSAVYVTLVWVVLKKRAKDTNDHTLDQIAGFVFIGGLLLLFVIGYSWNRLIT